MRKQGRVNANITSTDRDRGERPAGPVAPIVISFKPDGYYSHSRRELMPLIPPQAKRILEVGCGEGEFAHALRSSQGVADLELVGVEVYEKAAAVASTRFDRVFLGNFEHLQLGYDGYFDCVVFADVLEHMADPWAALLKARDYLKSDGSLVASIPNVQHWRVLANLLRGSWEYAPEGIMDRTHLRFFTRRTISKLFLDTGYRVRVFCAYLGTPFGRTVNVLTGRLFESFLAYQYFVLADRMT